MSHLPARKIKNALRTPPSAASTPENFVEDMAAQTAIQLNPAPNDSASHGA
jgi:hypothetical protein